MTDERNVVPLGRDPEPEPPIPPTPPGRAHGLAIAGMTLSALIAIVSGFLFIAIGWPGNMGKVVVSIGFLAAVSFLVCGAAAVFTAARDTYARSEHREHRDAR